jgi:hypothetical protein
MNERIFREVTEDEFWSHLEDFKSGVGYEEISPAEKKALQSHLPGLHQGPVDRLLADQTQYPVHDVQRGTDPSADFTRILTLKAAKVDHPCHKCRGTGKQPCSCRDHRGTTDIQMSQDLHQCRRCLDTGYCHCERCQGSMGYVVLTVVVVVKHEDDWWWVTSSIVTDFMNHDWDHYYEGYKSTTFVCDGLKGVRMLGQSEDFREATEPRRLF